MSLTTAFSTTAEYSTIFKRDFLCMYASFLRESPAFAEELCKQRDFLNDLLDAGISQSTIIYLLFNNGDAFLKLPLTRIVRGRVFGDAFRPECFYGI